MSPTNIASILIEGDITPGFFSCASIADIPPGVSQALPSARSAFIIVCRFFMLSGVPMGFGWFLRKIIDCGLSQYICQRTLGPNNQGIAEAGFIVNRFNSRFGLCFIGLSRL